MKDILIGNRYLLLESVGAGGEARVFRARDNTTQNDVALRLPQQAGAYVSPHALPLFHPGWVQLLDLGSDSQHGPYQVFELLSGQTLGQIVQAGPLDSESWLDLVHQSLDAVGALHEAGFIHGDLNAGNLLRAADRWKLLELPFLHFDLPAAHSSLFGSIYTLTPEHLDGTPLDPRSDLYALGCLYYYAASGKYPHAGASSQEIAVNRLRFPPTPLAEIAPRFPAARNAWVMTLLQREPKNRFSNALAARQQIGAI